MYKFIVFNKINITKVLIFFPLILQTNLCFSDWVNIAKNEEKIFFIDSTTIIPHMGSRRMAKELHEFREPGVDGITSLRIKSEFDCNEKKTRLLAQDKIIGEMGVGKIVSLNSNSTPWNDVKTDPARLKILNFVCSFEDVKH